MASEQPLPVTFILIDTGTSLHYEYASAVMMGLIFLGVKQRETIKHT